MDPRDLFGLFVIIVVVGGILGGCIFCFVWLDKKTDEVCPLTDVKVVLKDGTEVSHQDVLSKVSVTGKISFHTRACVRPRIETELDGNVKSVTITFKDEEK